MVGPHHQQPSAFACGYRREGGFELLPHVHALRRFPFVSYVLRGEDVGAAFHTLAIDDPSRAVGGHRGAAQFDDFSGRPIDRGDS